MIESGLLSILSIFSKRYNENWSEKIFIISSVLKINPWN